MHAGPCSCKLKDDWKFFRVCLVRNGCGQSSDGTIKLTVSEGWADEINCFFACWYVITKIKIWLKIFWLGMVKSQKWVWPAWSWESKIVSQKWAHGISWFFAWWYKFRKTKCWFNNFWVGVVKNGHGILGTPKSIVS